MQLQDTGNNLIWSLGKVATWSLLVEFHNYTAKIRVAYIEYIWQNNNKYYTTKSFLPVDDFLYSFSYKEDPGFGWGHFILHT